MADRRVPIFAKMQAAAAIIYVISPFDLLPGALVPFFGWLEDLLIFYLSMRLLVKLSPDEVVREHVKAVSAGR